MMITLNFNIFFLLLAFCDGEVAKSTNDVVIEEKKAATEGIVKFNVTKSDNLPLKDTNIIDISIENDVTMIPSISNLHKITVSTHAANKTSPSSSTTYLTLAATTPFVDSSNNLLKSTARKSTKLPMANMLEFKNLTQSLGDDKLMKVLSGKEITFIQLMNGKQINVAKKTNQIIFGSGSDKDKKTKIDELSQYLATEKPINISNVDELVLKELDTFVATINCYKNVSEVGRNSTKLFCSQDKSTSKNSVVKKIVITKESNIKLYGGINSLKFKFADKGSTFEISYEILRT